MGMGLSKLKMEDFIETVNAVKKEYRAAGRSIQNRRALQIAVLKPAKRFYISVEEAIRQINNIKRGKGLCFKSSVKAEMYGDIYKMYLNEVVNGDDIEYKYDLIERIITSPAPKFYINAKNAEKQIRYYYNHLVKQS